MVKHISGLRGWPMTILDYYASDAQGHRLEEIKKSDLLCYRIMTIDDYDKVYNLWMSCRNMGFNTLMTPGRESAHF